METKELSKYKELGFANSSMLIVLKVLKGTFFYPDSHPYCMFSICCIFVVQSTVKKKCLLLSQVMDVLIVSFAIQVPYVLMQETASIKLKNEKI